MFEDDFAKRLTQLRIEKDVSAREMSLSLGQSESYINRIESRKMLPSMTVFFYICEYFGITPGEFFIDDAAPSMELLAALKKLQSLDSEKRRHILDVISDL
ncbi:MAG: helix-turn-helix domain-containing protein [Blautia sp.]|nr:helix-turn-helix domain-containing protein [Muribaculaceae bacterium]MCM1144094.1 helix-turn-helix domain-containing protein [Lachnoclostridium sp.]MCM1211854.1 helix-turn-helix domain-containing protein [Blautia sp.]